MSRLAIIVGILATGFLCVVFQKGHIGELRREIGGLRRGAGGGEASPVAAAPDHGMRPSLRPPSVEIRGPRPEGRPEVGGAKGVADDLKVSELMGRMALTGEQRRRLEPLLTEYVAEEHAATSELLETVWKGLQGYWREGGLRGARRSPPPKRGGGQRPGGRRDPRCAIPGAVR